MKNETNSSLSWAVDLSQLLDKIELVADNEKHVRELLSERFNIAKNNGITVEFEVIPQITGNC